MRILLAGALVLLATAAHAASSATFTLRQDADCAAVASWDMLSAPITTANPNPGPSSATVLVALANTPTPCANGIAFSRTVNVVLAAGQVRFWMRAVGTDGTLSGVSNSLDRSVPPARPVAVDVSF